MQVSSCLRRLNAYDDNVFNEIEELAIKSSSDCEKLIFELIQSPELHDDADLAGFLLQTLRRVIGDQTVEGWILAIWPNAATFIKQRIVSAFFVPATLSISLAEKLFSHSSSDVWLRHQIVSALAASERNQRGRVLVARLLPLIGRYEGDADRQGILDQFCDAVRSELGTEEDGDGRGRDS